MEIFKNDLDYKILDLFHKGYTKINETEYFLEKKAKNLIFFEEDKKYSISKNLKIYCYWNNKRIKTNRKINELEEELMKLILDGYVKIDNVEYEIYTAINGIQRLAIKRIVGEKLITKKYECDTGKLILISTKRNNRLHSFNGKPCMVRFKYRNKIIGNEKIDIKILHCENGIVENYEGASEYNISVHGNNVISKSKKYYVDNKIINENCYKMVKDFSENGINIEKFYEKKNKFNFDSKQMIEAIERFNEHYKRKDKELEKLEILVNLEG